MTKKFLLIFFMIILLLFSFSINTYASTEYSVYSEDNNGWYIQFSDEMKKDLELPNKEVPLYLNSENIYFILFKNSSDIYYMIISQQPIVGAYNNSDNPYYSIRPNNYTAFTGIYKCSSIDSEWELYKNNAFSYSYYITNNLLFCSDDVVSSQNSSESLISKTIYTPKPSLTRIVRDIELTTTVTKEIVSILPVTLTVVISLIAIRKGISFIQENLRNA